MSTPETPETIMVETDFVDENVDSEGPGFPIPTVNEVGWILVGGGVLGAIISLLRDRRGIADLAVPLGLIVIGSGVLLERRQTRMVAAEESIRTELDALDPIARAQILKAIAKDELAKVPGLGSSE